MAEKQYDDQQIHIESKAPDSGGLTISRRGFLKGIGTSAVTAAVAPAVLVNRADAKQSSANRLPGVTEAQIQLRVNGKTYTANVEARTTLASALRDHIDLTGTKVVCDRGECGACTVIMNGKTIYSCMTLAMDAQGKEIITVEGVGDEVNPHPVQKMFVEKDALMCGYCTPGFVVSAKALLDQNPNPTLDDVKRGVSGNICRCGTYPRVFEATLAAAEMMRKGG